MSVLTLAEAKAHLNITGTTFDTELQDMIDSAEAVVGEHCGPLASASQTERIAGGDVVLALSVIPAVSLTSVTPYNSAALTLADLNLDQSAGLVSYDDGSTFTAAWYDVTYSAGRASVPDDLLLGVKELVRHLWDSQRGGTRRPGSGVSETTANTVPGAAYLLPFRVAELLAPHMQVGL